ncbi:MAG: FG-GAP repeat domain-containing protein, partial [Actinomycetota bacterium]
MTPRLTTALVLISASVAAAAPGSPAGPGLDRVAYRNPGLTADLGVGLWAWPIPVDFDADGDLDLVVSCQDKPYNGAYFFENASGKVKFPVFKPGRRISKGLANVSPSYVAGKLRVLTPGLEHPDFLSTGLEKAVKLPLPPNIHPNKVRANQWKYVDYNGDGALDLVVGVGDWTEYGWDDAYDRTGKWTNGPLHGHVYLLLNTGSTAAPAYAPHTKVQADGKPVDVFGMPSPNFADFDKDGDLDLLCGEFLDGFTYFENTGTRQRPEYSRGRRLSRGGKALAMDLQMIVPVAIDWDGDGDQDLVVGDEDGRVALIENTGKLSHGVPQFQSPRYFQQEAADLKCGALATPVGFDWDNDGDQDLVSGNTAGYIELFENLSGPKVEQPRWAAPKRLSAGGKTIRIQAGYNGSIQGPCEAKWGYTSLTVAD